MLNPPSPGHRCCDKHNRSHGRVALPEAAFRPMCTMQFSTARISLLPARYSPKTGAFLLKYYLINKTLLSKHSLQTTDTPGVSKDAHVNNSKSRLGNLPLQELPAHNFCLIYNPSPPQIDFPDSRRPERRAKAD